MLGDSEVLKTLPAAMASLRVQRFEEAEHLGEVARTEDGERAVTDQQVRADRCDAVDVSWDGVHGYPVIERDPCGDQGASFETCLDDEKDIGEASDDAVPRREPPAADP